MPLAAFEYVVDRFLSQALSRNVRNASIVVAALSVLFIAVNEDIDAAFIVVILDQPELDVNIFLVFNLDTET